MKRFKAKSSRFYFKRSDAAKMALKTICLALFFLIFSISAFSQSEVTGVVKSGDLTVSGVSVVLKGGSKVTQTNSNGVFKINMPENGVLVFSHIGYASKEVLVTGNQITVELQPNEGSLAELVVVGYNSQRKATLTGSVSQVKGADIVKSPQPNLSNSLAGRFSGVVINNRSGEPGYDGSGILIRGLATTGNNDVLIVVDGVPGQVGGLERLNPNDIETISVLKDASAAIYGSRAANGVILITTKRGKSGKPSISATYNQGFSSPTRLPKMADAATYAAITNEVAYYNNPGGGLNQQYSATDIQKFSNGSDPINFPNTDWADATLKRSTPQNQANVSVSGGTDNVRYYFSAGTFFQDGIYKNGATKYNQYSFRSNLDANITKDFKVGLYLSGREENRRFPTSSAGSIFRSIYRAYSTLPAIYPNGLPSRGIEGSNPVIMSTDLGGLVNNPNQIFNGILKGSYNINAIKGLSIDGYAAFDKSWGYTKSFVKPYSLYSFNSGSNQYVPTIVGGPNNLSTLNEQLSNTQQITSNVKLNFQRTFKNHSVNSFVGFEQSQYVSNNFFAYRQNFPTYQTPELSQGGAAANDQNNGGGSYNFTRRSFFAKMVYNYADKYFTEVQMRLDGSSTFPKGNQYGFFPAVSAGWKISKEKWFNVKSIDDLKLRASYGRLGNDNVGLFQYFNNYSFNNQLVLGSNIVSGIDLSKLGNENIHWEQAEKMDIGLDATILKNFTVEFIYFQQKRNNILAFKNASIPFVSGIVNPYNGSSLVPAQNIGKIDNAGIEASVGYNVRKKDFSWGASANFTYAKSKIINIDEAAGVLDYQKQTGRPLNTYLLYNAIGIFRTNSDLTSKTKLAAAQLGDLIYEDYNNDGKITADDQVRSKYGNIPEIMYGFLLNAGYKNVDISMVFSGQAHVSQYIMPESGTIGNFYSSWADNRWSPSNVNGTFPRVDTRTSSSINGGLFNNTFWLYNASFLRLKNVELGYNLSDKLLQKAKIQSVRFYMNAFNLFTITQVKDVDPEGNNQSGQFYPQQRIVNLGVAVKF